MVSSDLKSTSQKVSGGKPLSQPKPSDSWGDSGSSASSSSSSAASSSSSPSGASGAKPSFFGGIYYWCEDRYYDYCDFLQNKLHFPIYKFWVDPIESRGVPSFPVSVFAWLLILGILAFLLFVPITTVDLTVKVVSGEDALYGANVTVLHDGFSEFHLTGPSGNAVFPNMIAGHGVFINASKQGFWPVNESYSLVLQESRVVVFEMDSSLAKLKPNQSLIVRVFALEKGKKVFLDGVLVEFSSASGEELGSASTDSRGEVVLQSNGQSPYIYLVLFKPGYKRLSSGGVSFDSKSKEFELKQDLPPKEEIKFSKILVSVANSSGKPVVSSVSVFYANGTGPVKSMQTDAAGAVEFEFEIGSKLYFNAEPVTSADKAKYAIYYGSKDSVSINSESEEKKITLSNKNLSAYGAAVIIVQDLGSNASIPSAEVTLYDSYSKGYLQRASTDAQGKAEFSLPNSTLAYASIYVSGYLPAGVVNVKANTTKIVFLERANATNSGNLRVFVKEKNQSMATGATVSLFRELDGFPVGLPSQNTNGSAIMFSNVPTYFEVYASAYKGARSGRSDRVKASPNSTVNATVILEEGKGNVTVFVYNFSSSGLVPNASVSAISDVDNKSLSSCITGATGSCLLQVASYVDFTIKAVAPGFAETVLQQDSLPVDAARNASIYLVPSGLQNQLLLGLANVTEKGGSANASQVERGKTYTARFVVNFPPTSNKTRALIVRFGGQGKAADSDFLWKEPTTTDYAIVRGTDFYNANCTSIQTANNCDTADCKWLRLDFAGKTPNSFNLELDFKARAQSASNEQEMQLNYRALSSFFANNEYQFLRAPTDSSLPNEAPADSDACGAKVLTYKLPVAKGASSCSDKACVTVVFKNSSGEYGEGFFVQKGSKFNATVKTSLSDKSISGPYSVNVSFSPHALLIKEPSGWTLNANGVLNKTLSSNADFSQEFELNASIPTLSTLGASVDANYSFGVTQKVQGQTRYTVNGSVWLVVFHSVQTLSGVGVEMLRGQQNNLTINVTDLEGRGVSNARVVLNNNDSSGVFEKPFATKLPITLVGNDTLGFGLNGLYVFYNLSPESFGWAVANASLQDGSAKGGVFVNVAAPEFFAVIPSALFTCARQNVSVNASNNLAFPVPVIIGIPSGCISLVKKDSDVTLDKMASSSPGFDNYTFLLSPKEKANISFVPVGLAAGDKFCTIYFNATYNKETFWQNATYANAGGDCKSAQTPNCTIIPKNPSISPTASRDLTLFAQYNDKQPSDVTQALLSCDENDEGTLVALNSSQAASRTCTYPAATQDLQKFTFSSNISSAKALLAPGIGHCETIVSATGTGTPTPIPTPAPYGGNPGGDFVIDESGINAVSTSFVSKVSPLVPTSAFKVTIKNLLAESKTVGISVTADGCLLATDLSGNALPDAVNVGAESVYEFAIAYNTLDTCTPQFGIERNTGGITLNPEWSTTMVTDPTTGDETLLTSIATVALLDTGFTSTSAQIPLSVVSPVESKESSDFSIIRLVLGPLSVPFEFHANSGVPTTDELWGVFINNLNARPSMKAAVYPNNSVQGGSALIDLNAFKCGLDSSSYAVFGQGQAISRKFLATKNRVIYGDEDEAFDFPKPCFDEDGKRVCSNDFVFYAVNPTGVQGKLLPFSWVTSQSSGILNTRDPENPTAEDTATFVTHIINKSYENLNQGSTGLTVAQITEITGISTQTEILVPFAIGLDYPQYFRLFKYKVSEKDGKLVSNLGDQCVLSSGSVNGMISACSNDISCKVCGSEGQPCCNYGQCYSAGLICGASGTCVTPPP